MDGNPGQSADNPTHSAGNPFNSVVIPTHSIGNPTHSAGIPYHSTDNPANSASIPANSADNPAYSFGNPANSAGNPAHSAGNPETDSEDVVCLPTPSSFSTFRWRRRSTASHIIFKTRLMICRRFRYLQIHVASFLHLNTKLQGFSENSNLH